MAEHHVPLNIDGDRVTSVGQPRFIVEQRSPDHFAVLRPNPDHNKPGVCYAGEHLTVCTMDGRGEAEMVAAALNAYAPAQRWPA